MDPRRGAPARLTPGPARGDGCTASPAAVDSPAAAAPAPATIRGMPSVTVRPMTPPEFARMMAAADEDYAARQVEAGA